jgi:hypothetical protein
MSYEIRLNEDGSLDEVVASKPKHFHLEQMDTGAWWIGVDMEDGTHIRIDLWTQRNARIKARAEVEGGPGPWTQGGR